MNLITSALPFLRRALLVLLVGLALAATAAACPNCKEGMNSKDPHKTNIAKGYYYSVLFLLGTPPTILAGWGLAIHRAFKKAKREQESNASQAVPDIL